MPTLTILAGPNGAGKSFFSNFFTSEGYISVKAINIDALEDCIDTTHIPHDPMRYQKSIHKEIDKIFIDLCQTAIQNNLDFCFETNLRADQLTTVPSFLKAGYSINLIFLYLDSIELSTQRVKNRVSEGGHEIGEVSIKQNFEEGLKNLDDSVANIDWNHVLIIDNSKDVKGKEDPLSLLLEMREGKIIELSENFLSAERDRLLPKLCKMVRENLTK